MNTESLSADSFDEARRAMRALERMRNLAADGDAAAINILDMVDEGEKLSAERIDELYAATPAECSATSTTKE